MSCNGCYEQIFMIARQIPCGKVMTYGQIADACVPKVPAIVVGRAMKASRWYAPDLPWWRVIGRVGAYGVLRILHDDVLTQRHKLAEEGILPDEEGRYELAAHLYYPET